MFDFNPTPNGRPAAVKFEPSPFASSPFARAADRERTPRHRRNGDFGVAEETALAQALLSAADATELKRLLRALIEKAWGTGASARPHAKRSLVRLLEAAGEQILPALSNTSDPFGAGRAEGARRGKLGSLVKQALNTRTRGLAPQKRDLETARIFVRAAAKAARAAASPPADVDPTAHARNVLTAWAAQMIQEGGPMIRSPVTASAPTRVATEKAIFAAAPAPRRLQAKTSGGGPHTCTTCAQSARACQCGTVNRNGYWVRRGRSIIIHF
ncbi:hypothetical protein SAMN05444581_11159 [Methylocapsa palsarum]|uniref:Uncharacterized protein n=1 Tax=Methylocapsa palsarum TaxID=1612308 RepID=A0A1I4ARK7_9HYPH|nr:hypothetical protein SAMN05444581_11159 [Methylocapsa palsarum]